MNTQVIKKAIITERSLKDAAKGVFTFAVSLKASKHQIKTIVEETFGVEVIAVRTTMTAGDRYRVGKSRREKVAIQTKKARVALKPGQKIDLFEVGGAA